MSQRGNERDDSHWIRIRELKQRFGTQMRDLANSFLDDPFAADDVMHDAFRRLRRMRPSELGEDEKLPGILADIIVRMCLRRLGLSACENEVFRAKRASVNRIAPTACPRSKDDEKETG